MIQFIRRINDDDELIHKSNATDAGRVVVNRFQLMVPKLTPKDSMYDKFVSSFLQQTEWNYMREMYKVSPATRTSGFFQMSFSIDNLSIFLYISKIVTEMLMIIDKLKEVYTR